MTVFRFGELCSCYCLPLLTQLACSILATWERPYIDFLYCRVFAAVLAELPILVRLYIHSYFSICLPLRERDRLTWHKLWQKDGALFKLAFVSRFPSFRSRRCRRRRIWGGATSSFKWRHRRPCLPLAIDGEAVGKSYQLGVVPLLTYERYWVKLDFGGYKHVISKIIK